jgi:phosphate transport system substrate-binding protein
VLQKKFISRLALVALLGTFVGGSANAERKIISADGSSTVFPITSGIAEEFQKTIKDVNVTVGIAGTGGGFKRFVRGETDISDASRPISAEEMQLATQNKISFIELPIAYDGISVMVNPANDFVKTLTVEQLKRIWQKDSAVKMWSDVNPTWPKRKISLYGPGTDSGTFDYFTKAINGTEKSCRADFTASEDDNTLVTGIANDKDALGYFGFAYYVENKLKLKLVPIDNGKGAIEPNKASIANGTYAPLSRPIFIYVNKASLARPEVDKFVKFYLSEVKTISKQVGYIPFNDSVYAMITQRYNDGTLGSLFTSHGSQMNVHLEEMLRGASTTKKK